MQWLYFTFTRVIRRRYRRTRVKSSITANALLITAPIIAEYPMVADVEMTVV
jgi:hypothetical protein